MEHKIKNKVEEPFSFKKRLESFRYAFKGFVWLFRFEHNSRIHLFSLIAVTIAGFFFQISKEEWALLFIVCGFVFAAEAFNSSIEFLADEVSLEKRDKIGKSKDLAATGVLIAAFTALIIGLIIFVPKIISLLN
ncbi:diacylglycerol kinase family protein [Flavobacterium sp. FBOR7N2.3]|uniref:Diacylglycerol kinase family protein n=1 Tax=Flavobacterium magnesitis TaxID=3138077 RepID=A0ABV4TN54_9FLAO